MPVRNLESVKARLGRIPERVKAKVRAALAEEVDGMVSAMKRAAPVLSAEEARAAGVEPGALRDAIHAYPNPSRDLSWRIVENAKDEHGHPISQHVEFGHRAADGSHVSARPHFFPTYRARKRAMRRHLNRASREAFRER